MANKTFKPVSSILEIDGFAEALDAEWFIRSASFLDLRERVAGFELVQMTLAHYVALRTIDSPFIPPFRSPSPIDTASFIWLLSPEYQRDNREARASFLRSRCNHLYPDPKPAIRLPFLMRRWENRLARCLAANAEVVACLRRYVEDSLMDKPASVNKPGSIAEPEYYSDACSIVASLAKHRHFSHRDVMSMPIKCLFQYLNEVYHSTSDKPVMGNPRSDKVVNEYMKAMRASQN